MKDVIKEQRSRMLRSSSGCNPGKPPLQNAASLLDICSTIEIHQIHSTGITVALLRVKQK